jgi:hypothetical protein
VKDFATAGVLGSSTGKGGATYGWCAGFLHNFVVPTSRAARSSCGTPSLRTRRLPLGAQPFHGSWTLPKSWLLDRARSEGLVTGHHTDVVVRFSSCASNSLVRFTSASRASSRSFASP